MAHLHLDKFRDTCEVLGHDIDCLFLKLTLLRIEVMLYFELKMKSHKRLKVIVGIGTKNLF